MAYRRSRDTFLRESHNPCAGSRCRKAGIKRVSLSTFSGEDAVHRSCSSSHKRAMEQYYAAGTYPGITCIAAGVLCRFERADWDLVGPPPVCEVRPQPGQAALGKSLEGKLTSQSN